MSTVPVTERKSGTDQMEGIPEESETHHDVEEPEKVVGEALLEEQQTPEQAQSEKPLVQRARKLLNKRMRVGVTDGRLFFGKFHCLDKQGNIILSDTVEQMEDPSSAGNPELRHLGLVLIPAIHQTSCHVECSLYEQMSLLSIEDRS
eukprot:TRINITY_DN21676_c0_g1_i1.p1 TRINITY_DN21676_c0_g1~~TRINITY_DN21676_c0_g1_i1.p1  ORF type:complete len:147 (+),score=19.07 TRINITY_DN21676_c0_g1_i1:129-569(+)